MSLLNSSIIFVDPNQGTLAVRERPDDIDKMVDDPEHRFITVTGRSGRPLRVMKHDISRWAALIGDAESDEAYIQAS